MPFDSPMIEGNYSRRVRLYGGASSPNHVYECTKKHLFREEEAEDCELASLNLDIHSDSIEVVQKLPPSDQFCYIDPEAKSEVSVPGRARTSSERTLDGSGLYSRCRAFGNAASRINSNVAYVNRSDFDGESTFCEGNRRGVGLYRLTKLKKLGPEHAFESSKQLREQYGESSF